MYLAWRPDGRELAFSSEHEEACSLYESDVYAIGYDGAGYRRVTNSPACAALAGLPKGSVKVNVTNSAGPRHWSTCRARRAQLPEDGTMNSTTSPISGRGFCSPQSASQGATGRTAPWGIRPTQTSSPVRRCPGEASRYRVPASLVRRRKGLLEGRRSALAYAMRSSRHQAALRQPALRLHRPDRSRWSRVQRPSGGLGPDCRSTAICIFIPRRRTYLLGRRRGST